MENEMTLVAPPQVSKPRTMTAGARAKSASRQDIGDRAYQKWEAAGKPTGKDLKFWLEAQRELSRPKQQMAIKN